MVKMKLAVSHTGTSGFGGFNGTGIERLKAGNIVIFVNGLYEVVKIVCGHFGLITVVKQPCV